jgi:hypothetical protein
MLSGCARYWYQEGKTFYECEQDREDCRNALLKRTKPTKITSEHVKSIEDCMKKRGYRLVKGSELPQGTARELPDTTLHYRAKGVAGVLKRSD